MIRRIGSAPLLVAGAALALSEAGMLLREAPPPFETDSVTEDPTRTGPGTEVRILLGDPAASASARLEGAWDGFPGGRASDAQCRFSVRDGRIRADCGDAGSFEPGGEFRPASQASSLRVGRRAYRGALRVAPVPEGVALVNVAGLEDYLRGVVPGEIGRRLPQDLLEAAKAQAVVARTYALRALGQYGKPWDLRDDVRDQVYEGRLGEDPLCSRAVEATAGLLLLDSAGNPVDAFYHASSGGRTADIARVWPSKPARPYLRGVADTAPDGSPWSPAGKPVAWSESWDAETLHRNVRSDLATAIELPCDPGRVDSLWTVGRDASGRVGGLRVRGDKGVCDVPSDRARWALRRDAPGRPILRSALFTLRREGGRYLAEGAGNGHGVGMSQLGAMARARAGQDCSAILSAYYPGTRLAPSAP